MLKTEQMGGQDQLLRFLWLKDSYWEQLMQRLPGRAAGGVKGMLGEFCYPVGSEIADKHLPHGRNCTICILNSLLWCHWHQPCPDIFVTFAMEPVHIVDLYQAPWHLLASHLAKSLTLEVLQQAPELVLVRMPCQPGGLIISIAEHSFVLW